MTEVEDDGEEQVHNGGGGGGAENGERVAAAPERDVCIDVREEREEEEEEEEEEEDEEEEEEEVEEGGFAYEARVRNPAGFAAFIAYVFRCGTVVMREEDQVEQLAEVRDTLISLQRTRCPTGWPPVVRTFVLSV